MIEGKSFLIFGFVLRSTGHTTPYGAVVSLCVDDKMPLNTRAGVWFTRNQPAVAGLSS